MGGVRCVVGGIEECGGRGKHVTRLAACRLPRCMKAQR